MDCAAARAADELEEKIPLKEREQMEAHLQSCEDCRGAVREQRERRGRMTALFARLDPMGHEQLPDREEALSRLLRRLEAEPPRRPAAAFPGSRRSWADTLNPKERIQSMASSLRNGRWRPFLLPASGAACIAALLLIAPARAMLTEFLSIFRVREFSAVPVEHAQMEKLAVLAERLKDVIQEPVMDRKAGEPKTVADAAEATAAAGFTVRVPSDLPAGAAQTDFSVVNGPAFRIDFDRDRIQSEINAAGLSAIELPQMQAGPIRVDVSSVVHQGFTVISPGVRDTTLVEIVQAPSPTVTLPAGANPQELGRSFLQLAGMPAAEADQLSREIDWTCTLVVPIPRDIATFQQVDVGGARGLLLVPRPTEKMGRPPKVLLWQRDGIIYSIRSDRSTSSEMLRLAESLH